MKASDVPPGEIFVISERIGDPKGDVQGSTMEVRETYYLRDPDGPCRHPSNVKVARLATIQGVPSEYDPPRYKVLLDKPCRDPGELDGRLQVNLLGPGFVWASHARPAFPKLG